MPEISVIVPVYKAEPYLHRCVDSILNQTFSDFELILVDDGSPDKCPVICDQYAEKDQRIRVIHKKNGGVSGARNAGIQAAQGNWVAFVDSDDYCGPDYLMNLFDPDYDFCTVGYFNVYPQKKLKQRMEHSNCSYRSFTSADLAYQIHLCNMSWLSFACCHLFRLDLIRQCGIEFDTHLTAMEDTIFTAQYFTACKSIKVTSTYDYYYMHHGGKSLSTTLNSQYFACMYEADKRIAELMEQTFHISYPRKLKTGLPGIYVWFLGIIVGNDSFSYRQQISALRFIFKSPYFQETLKEMNTFYPGTSNAYRKILSLKCPFLFHLVISIKNLGIL